MASFWCLLSPELRQLPASDQVELLEQARGERFTTGETIVLVVWLIVVFLFVQQVVRQSGHENRVLFALVANLAIGAPAALAVVVPVYVRKMRRGIAGQIARRRSARRAR